MNWWRKPWRAPKMHFQSIVIIQPIDMMADGEANMCDGCPDITVHVGELHWSCRLDERLRWGCNLQAAPKCRTARLPVVKTDEDGDSPKTKPGRKKAS